jgi:hypothetical protein
MRRKCLTWMQYSQRSKLGAREIRCRHLTPGKGGEDRRMVETD